MAAAATLDLRQRVLRPDQRIDELARPGDDHPLTAHFGAFYEGRLAAVATIMPEQEPDGPGLWRIRGVATEPALQGRGHGRAVVEACLAHARAHRGACVAVRGQGHAREVAWLNGRVPSRGFYEGLGFRVVGEPFDTPPSGAHLRFRRAL